MSQRGSVIVWGLLASGVIGVVTMTAGTMYENFSRQAHLTAVRSRLTSLETTLRTMAFQPYSYTCGADAGSSAVADVSSCTVNTAYYASIRQVLMPGADCANGPGTCGFRLTGPTITPSGAVANFRATIAYEGREAASLRPSDVNLTIPTELLQSSRFDCALVDPKRPSFVGFKANGSPDCRGFRPVVNGTPGAEGQPCPRGTYATMVNFSPLTVQCANLATPDKVVDCGPGTAVGTVQWENGVVTSSCVALPAAPF